MEIQEKFGIFIFSQLMIVHPLSSFLISSIFSTLKGVCEPLCEACERLDWKIPTKIQAAALPHALGGRDVIGLAETGFVLIFYLRIC